MPASGEVPMARSDLLRRLFAGYAQSNDQEFRRAANDIIADERRKNHRLLANELERALNVNRRPGGEDLLTLRPIPKSRDERPLLRLIKPKRELAELVLAPAVRGVIDEIIEENRRRGDLRSNALYPRQRLLFVGSPGTGKSATAHAIASELSLPVAVASLPALTSSFMGDTARNVESVVRFAEQMPCVLLLDEFDVLGQERAHERDHGEMRRVAATVLQLLEDFHGESLVVATSNHPGLVDSAMWRRFDGLVGFDGLNASQLAELIRLKLRAHPSTIDVREWAERMTGFTPAEVELACFDAMRRTILAGKSEVDDEAMAAATQCLHDRRQLLMGATPLRQSD